MSSKDYLEHVWLQRGNVYNKAVNLKLLVYMVKVLEVIEETILFVT